MKQLFFIALFLVNFTKAQDEEANRIITLFIEDYPSKKKSFIDKDNVRELCNIIECTTLDVSPKFGIFSTYMGYLTLSNEAGQITFPRKTVKESINLLIAPKIFPIFMFQNTIAYWHLPQDVNAKLYRIDKKRDEETGLYYWETSEKKIGEKRRVPLHTIVIFSNPESIYVPTGVSLSNNNPQLVLPTIYAKKDRDFIKNAFFILTIKPFFAKINKLFQERPFGYATHIID